MAARRYYESSCARAAARCRAWPIPRCVGRRELHHDDPVADSRLRDRFGRFGAGLAAVAGRRRGRLPVVVGHALASWLPLRVRQALGFDRGRVLLQIDRAPIALQPATPASDGLQLRLQQGGELRDLGHAPAWPTAATTRSRRRGDPLAALLGPRLADLPRWLLLPAARPAPAPAAAGGRGRTAARCGRLRDRPANPFSADAVAFDARVLGRRDSDGQLDAELVAVPRSALRPRSWPRSGCLPRPLAGVDVAATDGTPLGVNLLPLAQRRRACRSVPRLELGARRGRRARASPRCCGSCSRTAARPPPRSSATSPGARSPHARPPRSAQS